MKNLILFLAIALTGTVNAQSSSAIKATISDPGALYSTFNWNSGNNKEMLAKVVSAAEMQNILKYSIESSWPAGISTFNARSNKQDLIKKYIAYKVAEVDMYYVIKIPSAANSHMPDDMRAYYDFYFVMGKNGVELGAGNVTKKVSTSSDNDLKYGTLDSLVTRLTIPKELTGGANGAGIAYDPVRKLYYAAMAGNKDFGLVIYNSKGLVVASTTTMIDVRGIWYNPLTKNIEVNGYDENGIAHYIRNDKGIPTDVVIDHLGKNQPDENSCGALNTADNTVLFIVEDDYDYKIEVRNTSAYEYKDEITINIPDDGEFIGSLNNTTVVYTGMPKAEIGILNTYEDAVYLVDLKTGNVSTKLDLSTSVTPEGMFNFSYANKLFWFFDKTNRVWSAYKMKLNK